MNLLKNPSFDGGWWRKTHTGQEFGEIFVPEGWTAYWREDKAVPHDPANPNGYRRPEMHVINREAPFLDPPRVLSGERALKFFTFFRIHDAGVYQVVEGFTPGQRVMATGWAHGWSSTKDDAECSDGGHVGCGTVCLEEGAPGLDDGDRNMTFRVGIDPTGATDPWGESVIWGPGRHIYNAFAQIPEVEVTAEAEAVTVFVRSSVLWPFKHCDAYVDEMRLEVVGEVGEPEPGECRGTPRIPYERTFLLLPPLNKISQAELRELISRLMPEIIAHGWTVGFSADDAGIGDLDVRNVIALSVHMDDWDRLELQRFFDLHYPDTELAFRDMFVLPHFPVGTDLYPPAAWYVPLTQLFSARHPGIDINLDVAPWGDVERGEPVTAILPGSVHFLTEDWGGVGMMIVKHTINGIPYWVQYAHQDIDGWGLGDPVDSGQILGHIADWQGGDGGDHLHFGVSTKPVAREYLGFDGWIDPVLFLKDVVGLDPIVVDAMVRKGDTPQPEPPDPEPEPPDPPSIPIEATRSNNEISLHSGEPKRNWDRYWVGSGATAMKVFSLGFAMEARRLVPDLKAIVLWRKHSDFLSVDTDPQLLVDRYSEEIATHCRNTGQTEEFVVDAVTAVESLNEQIPTFNIPQLQKAVEYDVGFAEALHQRYGDGLLPALLTGAIGNPHESEVKHLLPAARAAYTYGGFICYHAYWTADAQRNYLTDYWSIHAGRWMRWDEVFEAEGIYPRYLLSEGGIVYAPGGLNFNSGRGWKSCGSFDSYLGQMNTFNALVRDWNEQHQNRCAGLTVFCYGNWGWNDFDLGEGNLLQMLDYSYNWR